MKRQAFTLVELIVVITILAILGTIGFISLQGFSSDARDSKRISEIGEIRSGLQIYQARNSLVPTPSEEIVTIGSGTTDLIIQGYAGTGVLNEIRMNGDPKDPLEKQYYTYSVNSTKTKFQLLALLENDNNLTSFNTLNIIPTTHASYLNRYPYTVGGGAVGILLDEATNIPLQKLVTSIDLSTDTNNYKIVFSNDTINGNTTLNGIDLYNEIIARTNNTSTIGGGEISKKTISDCTINGVIYGTVDGTDSGLTCSDDIIICSGVSTGYAIASCNLGSTLVGTTSDSYGYLFQWGRNKGFPSSDLSKEGSIIDGNIGLNALTDEYGFVWDSTIPSPYSWASTNIDDNWGFITPKQGPCSTGYHVPSQSEWSGIVTNGGWGADGLGIMNDLKLPMTSTREYYGGTIYEGGVGGNYWTSTPQVGGGAIYLDFFDDVDDIGVIYYQFMAMGLPVRCIRD